MVLVTILNISWYRLTNLDMEQALLESIVAIIDAVALVMLLNRYAAFQKMLSKHRVELCSCRYHCIMKSRGYSSMLPKKTAAFKFTKKYRGLCVEAEHGDKCICKIIVTMISVKNL